MRNLVSGKASTRPRQKQHVDTAVDSLKPITKGDLGFSTDEMSAENRLTQPEGRYSETMGESW